MRRLISPTVLCAESFRCSLGRGGIDRPLKAGRKFGSLFYYATWLGLRGEDLCIDTEQTYTHTCSRHGVTVTFTGRLEDLETA